MALVGLAQDGGKKRIFDDSVMTAATARGFANGFFLGHLWDVLLWLRSSQVAVSHRQVARDGGAGGLSRGKGCLLYTSPSPRDKRQSRMPSSA